jgi:hypothetical protein
VEAVLFDSKPTKHSPDMLHVGLQRIRIVLPVVEKELDLDRVVQEIRIGHRLGDKIGRHAGRLESIQRGQDVLRYFNGSRSAPGQHEDEQTDQQQLF